MCCVILAYLDSQEKSCSQASVQSVLQYMPTLNAFVNMDDNYTIIEL